MVIHHVSFGARDMAAARRFYQPLMELLGLRLLQESARALDYGVSEIMFSRETPTDGGEATAGNGSHVGFLARDRDMVRRFHAVGLQNGGTDAGAPGVRPEYDANYFAAFLRDPDGNKVEALTFAAE